MEPEEIGVAIKAFMAESCPNCGDGKEFVKDPFCTVCFSILSYDLRERISDLKEFIVTFHPAMTFLKEHSPTPKSRKAQTNRR